MRCWQKTMSRILYYDMSSRRLVWWLAAHGAVYGMKEPVAFEPSH
jgi:hypothetical protein